MHTIGLILYYVLHFYLLLLLVRMVISWIPLIAPEFVPRGFVATIFEIIYTITDPPIRFFRRFIPPLRLGAVSLDLAFMAVFFVVIVLQRLILGLFF